MGLDSRYKYEPGEEVNALPLKVVPRSFFQGLGDTSNDPTVYLIYEDEDEV